MTLVRPASRPRPGRLAWPRHRAMATLAPLAGAAVALAVLRAPAGDPAAWGLAAAATAALVAWIAWQDLASLTIPDGALVALGAVAVALRWSDAGDPAWPTLAAMALDVGLCGGLLLAFREAYYRLKGFDGLGLGDVKLAAVGALLVGGIGFAWALFSASLAGLAAVALARLLRRGRAPVETIAFGAVLAPALWIVWLVGEALPRLAGS